MRKLIPYGISDFRELLKENYYYIDKTHFIPKLEKYGRFLYLIRPRRFGKSLFINMLSYYYDEFYKHEFNDILKETYIINNPTEEASSYYILKFDFSAVSTVGNVNDNFNDYCNRRIKEFINKYKINIKINETNSTDKNLDNVFQHIKEKLPDKKVYILIDEYDNFINNILMHSEVDYQKLVSSQSEAIYKEFFKLLKALTSDNASPLKRMFFTGVSPLALYDVTSGSNIGKNLTNIKIFNDIIGVTPAELDKLIAYYNIDEKYLDKKIFNNWYNNYKFSSSVDYTIYNTDMVLYYIDNILQIGDPPENLIDINVRTDYSKLKYIVYQNNQLNGNFNILAELFQNGEIKAGSIKDSFSAFETVKSENFISLLYYLGLLTINKEEFGEIVLTIPNQTIKLIMAEFLQRLLDESNVFKIETDKLEKLIKRFAYRGSLEIFYYLSDELKSNSKIRDYIRGEDFIKGFLVAYLSLSKVYSVHTEAEKNKGYVDIYLQKAPNIMENIPDILIELKYISKKEYSKDKLIETINNAKKQIANYKKETHINREQKSVIIIFKSWEMVYCKWEK